MPSAPDLPGLFFTIDEYLHLVQRHATAEEMMATILTDDFQVGFRGGHQWEGPDGLLKYLSQREGIFDERLELRQILSYVPVCEDAVEVATRVEFSFRRWEAPSPVSEEFTGAAFYTWLIRTVDKKPRVARVVIDGFANLNANARVAFAVPDEGFDE